MKNKVLLTLVSTAMFAGVLTGCGGHEHKFGTDWKNDAINHWHQCECGEKADVGAHIDDNKDNECDVCHYKWSSPTPVDDYYVVKVYEKTGIKASADVSRAKKGDTVTITISEIGSGYTLKAVKMNDVAISADPSNPMVYKFEMPNQSAVITFDLAVSGSIVIDGDFAVALTLNASTGIYEAKNVLVVNDPKEDAYFDVKVGETKLAALDLDESRSFGDVGCTFSTTHTFFVRAHNSYDFFYDPNVEEAPFSIQRVGVDILPTTVDELASLLITGYAVRSEAAIYSGVSSMSLKIDNIDGSDNLDVIHQEYNWKKYSNNVTYGKVVEKDAMGDPIGNKHVYKALDVDNRVISVVDTYDKKNGNLVANDDPYREDYNKYGAYAAKYDIITGDDYDYQRFSRNMSHANRMMNVSAHMPAYYIERDIMDSYRVGYEGSDEMSWNERIIGSTRNPDNSFVVTVDTKVEYKLISSSGADASQAWVFDVDLGFDERGAMTSISYSKLVYETEKWDFVNHKPVTGKTPVRVKKIVGTYGYETPSETFTTSVFDPTPYFVSKINSIKFYSPATGKPTDDGNSYVQLSDNIRLYDGDFNLPDEKSMKVTFDYEPSTALDIWEYGPTSSTNESVIKKMANDLYYEMSAVNEGDATVTFSNHHTGAAGGATYALPINVSTKELIRTFYLFPTDDPYRSITDATPENVKAGTIHQYYVNRSPEAAPLKYTAVSDHPEIAAVTSAPNADVLTIDFSSATSITKTEIVKITMTSDKYNPAFSGGAPVVFTFCIIPNDIDPIGTWYMVDDDFEKIDTTFITFTKDKVQGSDTEFVGRIHDEISQTRYYDATFAYSFDGLTLSARITSIRVVDSESWSTDPSDYILVFEYHPELGPSGLYGVGLAECVYDEYSEGFVCSPLLGEMNDDGEFVNLDGFRKFN